MLDVLLAAERVPAYARAWRELLKATISWKGQRPGLILTTDELRRIACPVAFAWGRHDPMVSVDDGRAAAAHIPGARFEVVGTGHAPWLDDAAAVARAIESTLMK
jgi:pimeloyl-ACP methyl ester carboxylesterase